MKKIIVLLLSVCTLMACAGCVVDMGGESAAQEESINTESRWSDENVDENGWV